MATGKFVSYLRVSTQRQGRSGLGVEAQRESVATYLNGGKWTLLQEFVEVESGKQNDRPKLQEAMALCRVYGATLVIARIDRLSRDAAFLLSLQNAGVRFVAADMPEANETVVAIMAVLAQAERRLISERTKAALQAAKARGKVLGGHRGYTITREAGLAGRASAGAKATARAADLFATIRDIRASGITSLGGIAKALSDRGVPTARGNMIWSPMQVRRVLDRQVSV